MNKYKLLIFDFDGTLCATHEAIIDCVNKAYQAIDKEPPNPILTDSTIRAGLGMEGTIKQLSPALADFEASKLLSHYEALYLQEGEKKSAPFPNAQETLIKLASAGFILTVVSNKTLMAVESALAHFHLKQYIAIVVGDTKSLKKKPDVMAYTRFIQPLHPHITPKEILVIGDTTADLLFAHHIGADACWAEYGYGDASACRQLRPAYTLKKLSDILALLL